MEEGVMPWWGWLLTGLVLGMGAMFITWMLCASLGRASADEERCDPDRCQRVIDALAEARLSSRAARVYKWLTTSESMHHRVSRAYAIGYMRGRRYVNPQDRLYTLRGVTKFFGWQVVRQYASRAYALGRKRGRRQATLQLLYPRTQLDGYPPPNAAYQLESASGALTYIDEAPRPIGKDQWNDMVAKSQRPERAGEDKP
jgi:hypothetical protein